MINYVTLPFRSDPHGDESFMGFLLRMSNVNGLQGLYWLYKLLARDRLNRLQEVDISAVSKIFGTSSEILSDSFVRKNRINGEVMHHAHGHPINRPYLMRHLRPQLCPRCIAHFGYSRSLWDFSMVCACPIHNCALIDTCGRCNKKIKWSRPSLRTCSCGAPWDHADPSILDNEHPGIQMARIVAARLPSNEGNQSEPCEDARPLCNLNLDILFRLIWIFGIKPSAADKVTTGVSRTILRSIQARGITERGLRRMVACTDNRLTSCDRIAAEIHIPSLISLAKDATQPTDLQFVGALLQKLGVNPWLRNRSGRSTIQQLTLF